MWLWVFYRAKEDGAVVLVSARSFCTVVAHPPTLRVTRLARPCLQGLVHPWDAHHHEHAHLHFEKEIGELPAVAEHEVTVAHDNVSPGTPLTQHAPCPHRSTTTRRSMTNEPTDAAADVIF